MTITDPTLFKTDITSSSRNAFRSILIVDDEPEQIIIIKKILTSAGYQVLEAETGAKCLELTRSERPDLILLDVNLADASGLDICRQIKDNSDISDIHIMFLSGVKTSPEQQAQGLRAGADGYLVKPVHKEEFLARIESIMRIAQTEEKLRESEEKHRRLFETMAQGVVYHASDGIIISANPAAERILGLKFDQMRGRSSM
ncbi:MAG: response regulator, partial [Desulfonatronovibrio sp.]